MLKQPSRTWACAVVLGVAAVLALLPERVKAAQVSVDITRRSSWPGADLFSSNSVHRLRLEIAPKDLESLHHEERDFVRAQVFEGETAYRNVAVRLRGGVGSFQAIDEKPGFTLDFDRFQSAQRFHGLRRVHLNNSVEDPSYCHEWLGSELFRQAGVPAPRVGHAAIELNGRRLGLYVLKEGFTEDFLSCYFNQIGGDLFEPGEGHDVNQSLKRNSVNAPRNGRGALVRLAEATLEQDPTKRWTLLNKGLDVEEFIRFMSLEVILCHRDGYCLARNNFRVYENVQTGKIQFFPSGMDQLLGSPELPLQPQMSGLVAKAVVNTEEGRLLFHRTLKMIIPEVIKYQHLSNGIDAILARIQPLLNSHEQSEAQTAVAELKQRLSMRRDFLRKQVLEMDQTTIPTGPGRLAGWSPERTIEGRLGEVIHPDGTRCLHISLGSPGQASWKTQALLDHGRYRFEGRARVSQVEPLSSGSHHGAGLRIGGNTRQGASLVGNAGWRELTTDFEVERDGTEVLFICELRAASGEAWFDRSSLRVIKLP